MGHGNPAEPASIVRSMPVLPGSRPGEPSRLHSNVTLDSGRSTLGGLRDATKNSSSAITPACIEGCLAGQPKI
jgi:hypothetical protein